MKLDYCVLGTNNIEEAIKFYDSLFEQTELNKVLSTERMTFWQCEDFAFAIAKPFNGEPASNGNGTMIGLNVGSAEEVKGFIVRLSNWAALARVSQANEGLNFLHMREI